MDRATRTPLVVIGGGLAVAVAAAVVVAALVRPASYEPGTPEAAVQEFVQAMLDDDAETALALIDPAGGCTLDALAVVRPDRVTARIGRVTIAGDVATVVVEFTESDGDLFGGEWSYRETFGLSRSGDGWAVENTTWFYTACLR
jgi:hypothetical protein